ncbi:MAG TPA: hypothetical protein VK422_02660 [Pyrinomonadaceae bacterium]|nr:hypothetical protein [Pyrinomonadaceae bacterium]
MIETSEWRVVEVAGRANTIFESLVEIEDMSGMSPNLIEYQEELASDLDGARHILEQYSELLDSTPGRGAIKGFMVRASVTRINGILEKTHSLRSVYADSERNS